MAVAVDAIADLGEARADVPPADAPTPAVGRAALTRVLEAHTLEPADLRDAVRFLLEELAAQAPGRSVEVRVPPYGAVQCVEGPRHTRGTPPNVVEIDPMTWVRSRPAARLGGRRRRGAGPGQWRTRRPVRVPPARLTPWPP